jgi:hypothetical protein
MKQDIRELFKNDEFPKKELPSSHKEEFLEKLKKAEVRKPKKKKMNFLLKVAASILLLFSVGYFVQNSIDLETQNTALEIQVEQIEKEYLKNIEKEWKAFVKNTDDQNLIKKYEEKLRKLDVSYKEVSKQFKENSENISVLESLIENLQRRLQLLKDIQEHIKELNQKKKNYETIVI